MDPVAYMAKRGLVPGNPGNVSRDSRRAKPKAFNAALLKAARDPRIVAQIAAIATGEAARKARAVDKDGKVVEYETTPEFNERTGAARAIWQYGTPKDPEQG